MASNQTIDDFISLLQYVDSIKDRMYLFSCYILSKNNSLYVYIQDWYDNMCSNYGHEVGLEKYFKLNSTISDDTYESIRSYNITGFDLLFNQKLKEALKKYNFKKQNGMIIANYKD